MAIRVLLATCHNFGQTLEPFGEMCFFWSGIGVTQSDNFLLLSGGAEVQLYRMHVVLVTAYRHVRHIVSRIIGQPDRPLAVLAHCQA